MMNVVKNVFTDSDEERRFQEAYRVNRAAELLERIRWRQNPKLDSIRDARGRLVPPGEMKDHPFWRLYFDGRPLTLPEDDTLAVDRVEKKLASGKKITPLDLYSVEQAYCKLSPFAVPDEEIENKVRSFIWRTAEEDVAAGRFENLYTALRHYGLREKAEERDAKAADGEEAGGSQSVVRDR